MVLVRFTVMLEETDAGLGPNVVSNIFQVGSPKFVDKGSHGKLRLISVLCISVFQSVFVAN
jgi:hypothetical protein